MIDYLKKAKEASTTIRHQGRTFGALTDDIAIDLCIAYAKGEVNTTGLGEVLKEMGYKIKGGNSMTVIASRILPLARRGLVEIKRK